MHVRMDHAAALPRDYVTLGRTGTCVSRLCLGTMTFGAEADEATSAHIYARARDAGINFFDTADMYGTGTAETILGRLTADDRDDVVIASKGYFPMGPDVNAGGLARRYLTRAVERSLARLGTDRLDLYYVHHFDDATPIEAVVRTLDDLQRAGKVVYLGVSNWAAWQIATALGASAREHLARFDVVQPMYNLVRRQAEVEILPLAAAEGLAVVPYSPLGAGLLTGKYGVDTRPAQGRLVENQKYMDRYSLATDYEVAQRLSAFAAEIGAAPAALAMAWVMTHPAVTAPIIGARSVAQLDGSLAALSVAMTPELRADVSALAPTPAPATDRTEQLRA